MSKSRGRKRKVSKKKVVRAPIQEETKKPSIQEETKKWWKRSCNLIGVFLAALGGAAAVASFLPRVTVGGIEPFDPSSSPTFFMITNTGNIPLENVQPMLGICVFATGPVTQADSDICEHRGHLDSRLTTQKWDRPRLNTDDKYQIALEDILQRAPGVQLYYANISVIVRYQPWFLPLTEEKEFRFFTRKIDGKLYWVSM